MSRKNTASERAKRSRDATIQRYVRERDKALDDLKHFVGNVNQHVGTAYNIMATALGYEFDNVAKKYKTEGRDLITLTLELVKKLQDADPSVPKIVERRDAPVEYEEKPRVVISGAVEESKKETLYEALEDIATEDEIPNHELPG